MVDHGYGGTILQQRWHSEPCCSAPSKALCLFYQLFSRKQWWPKRHRIFQPALQADVLRWWHLCHAALSCIISEQAENGHKITNWRVIIVAKRTIRIDDQLSDDIGAIAEDKNKSENATIEEALRFYRDYIYMKEKPTIINEEVLKVNKAGLDLLEQHINHKTNQVISALSIQVCILYLAFSAKP